MATVTANLQKLALEFLALTAAMAALVVIAASHHFGGVGGPAAHEAIGFSLSALALTALPLEAYVVLRVFSLMQRNGHLLLAATHDGLTRVLNKTTFRARVQTALAGSARRRGNEGCFALLIVDADHFKRINDRLGHAVGDQALIAIARTLTRTLREDDLIGRIGGEEFAILLRGAGLDEARRVAERLRLAVNALSVGSRTQRLPLSVSVGGIAFSDPVAFDTIYRAADANLYRAKKAGRNRVDLGNLIRIARRPGDARNATRILAGPAAA